MLGTFLTQAQNLQIQLTISHYVSYAGASDGAIDLTVTGGTTPYIYYWSNGETTEDISGLTEGFYYVRVYDDAGAVVGDGINLTEPPPLQIEITAFEYPNGYNVSCYGCYNGFITVTVIGNTSPYTFQWSDGPTTQNRSSLGQGTYQLQVTDANGGGIECGILLTEPQRDDWTMSGNANTNPATQFIGTTDNKDLKIKTNSSERITVTSSGDVKVNSLSGGSGMVFVDDDGILHNGNSLLTVPCVATVIVPYWGSTNGGPSLPPQIWTCPPVAVTIGSFQSPPPLNMRLSVFGNTYITGNTGLATLNPTHRLQVDLGNILIHGNNNFTSGGHQAILYLGDNNHYIKSESGYGLKIGSPGATDAIRIFSDGTVGIGIDPQTQTINGSPYKLLVGGKFGANEIFCSLGTPWPDFVFNKNYDLIKLDDLANYIREYNHLPGMPSANEISSKEKINLGDMQVKVVQKIEEVNLYILQFHERIKKLEKECDLLKSNK